MQNQDFRNNLRETYDAYAQERNSGDIQDWKFQERARFLAALKTENKNRLLDIGAGTGRDSKLFQDQGFEVVCIDLSPAMVELCRQKGLDAMVMDMANIDFPADSFDAVYSMNSMLHLSKEEFPLVLDRINTILNANGLVYIGMYGGYDFEGVWENDYYTPKRFFSFFSDKDLEKEVSRVFDILSFERVILQDDDPTHFQSLILQKKSPPQSW